MWSADPEYLIKAIADDRVREAEEYRRAKQLIEARRHRKRRTRRLSLALRRLAQAVVQR